MSSKKWLFLSLPLIPFSKSLKVLIINPCDATKPWQLGSQDAATLMMQGIIDLHHDISFFPILILVFISWMLIRASWYFHYRRNLIP